MAGGYFPDKSSSCMSLDARLRTHAASYHRVASSYVPYISIYPSKTSLLQHITRAIEQPSAFEGYFCKDKVCAHTPQQPQSSSCTHALLVTIILESQHTHSHTQHAKYLSNKIVLGSFSYVSSLRPLATQ